MFFYTDWVETACALEGACAKQTTKTNNIDMEASILYQTHRGTINKSRFLLFVGFPASKWSPKDAQDNFDP